MDKNIENIKIQCLSLVSFWKTENFGRTERQVNYHYWHRDLSLLFLYRYFLVDLIKYHDCGALNDNIFFKGSDFEYLVSCCGIVLAGLGSVALLE